MSATSALKSSPLSVLLSIGLFIYFSFTIGSTLYQSYQNKARLELLRKEVSELQSKRDQLKKQLSQQRSPQFIEQEARNKLGLAKPEETIVIFPEQQGVLGVKTEDSSPKAKASGTPSNITAWQKLFWQ